MLQLLASQSFLRLIFILNVNGYFVMYRMITNYVSDYINLLARK
jgi:hypothetical protein